MARIGKWLKNPLRLFLLGYAVLLVTTSPGGFDASDAEARYETAKSWHQGHRGTIGKNYLWGSAVISRTGEIYTLYNPLQSILMLPFVAVMQRLPLAAETRDMATRLLISLILFPAISLVTLYLLFLTFLELGFSRRVALWGVAAYALATPYLYYSRNAQEEGLVAAGYALWMWGIVRFRKGHASALYAVAAAGVLALATRIATAPTLVVLATLSLIAIVKSPVPYRHPLTGAIVLALTGVGLLAVYNAVRFGVPWESGYFLQAEHFQVQRLPIFEVLKNSLALWLSPYRGVVWYSPALVGAALLFSNRQFKSLPFREMAAAVGLATLFFGSLYYWSAGYCWGPRYLIASLILFAPLFPAAFSQWANAPVWKRWALGTTLALAVFVQGMSLTRPHNSEDFERGFRNEQIAGACGPWTVSCSPLWLRLKVLPALAKNTLTGTGFTEMDLSNREIDSKLMMESSDFKTLYWIWLRLSYRSHLYPKALALLLCALGFLSAVALMGYAILFPLADRAESIESKSRGKAELIRNPLGP